MVIHIFADTATGFVGGHQQKGGGSVGRKWSLFLWAIRMKNHILFSASSFPQLLLGSFEGACRRDVSWHKL